MDRIELHYYLNNNLHLMDAVAKNKADAQVLAFLNHALKELDLNITFEVEALEVGGIREFLIPVGQMWNDLPDFYKQALFTALLTTITGVATFQLTRNRTQERLQEENLRLSNRQISQELKTSLGKKNNEPDESTIINIQNNITINLENDSKIKAYRSKFYKNLNDERKVDAISASMFDIQGNAIIEELKIERRDFANLIIAEEELDPEIIEGAEIIITAPITDGRKVKWKGILHNIPISFSLEDEPFRQMVLNKQVFFTNGTTIRCDISKERKINTNGDIVIKGYYIYNVSAINGNRIHNN